MDQKNVEIVVAAKTLIGRYGYAKTTMAEIAKEAGVARQTVYNAFPNKEEILRAVVRHYGEEGLTQIKAAWVGCKSLEEKLRTFINLGPLTWFAQVSAAPDWAELIEGMHRISAAELRELDKLWVAEFTAILQKDAKADQAAVNAEELASFFYTTSKNAKFGVETTAELEARLNTILAATLALLKAD
ncbi:MAG: TetR/AcrR family transcriptional regulator [Pseudomonadota bacterium]